MASIDLREEYQKAIEPYMKTIEDLNERANASLQSIEGNNPVEAARKRIAVIELTLDYASYHIMLSGLSQSMLKARNEGALTEARQALYNAIIQWETILGSQIDAVFSEYADKLQSIAFLSATERYRLIKKMGLAIRLLEEAHGANSKLKWAFADMWGRYAAVAKNSLDMKAAGANLDARSPDYVVTAKLLQLIQRLLTQAAKRYREKYELSTKRSEDFIMAIRFLGALQQVFSISGPQTSVETVKKQISVWTAKLQDDMREAKAK